MATSSALGDSALEEYGDEVTTSVH